VEGVYSHGLELLTLKGAITFIGRGTKTTIDLSFATPGLASTLQACEVREDLDHGSDHLPTSISFVLEVGKVEQRPQRCWKSADLEATRAGARLLNTTGPLSSPEEIDQFVEYLTTFTQGLASLTVPWRKQACNGTAWWN
jgi:hypothetical protein